MIFYETIGSIPYDLCKLLSLTYIDIYSNQFICYPSCVTSVSNRDLGSYPVCPSFQDNALCGLIASTNIQSISGYSMWSCNSTGYTTTNPCASGSIWVGITCTNNYVSSIAIYSLSLQGIIILIIYNHNM